MNQTDSHPEPKKSCGIYADGFNLYYGVLKFIPEAKWLNLEAYFDSVFPRVEVKRINYFTAIIEGESQQAVDRKTRQSAYLSALRELNRNRVKIIPGKFQDKKVRCFGSCGEEYTFPQEKKTDVHIAMEMVVDAMQGNFDVMVLVSGDSDLHPVCQWIRKNRPEIVLHVLIPALPSAAGERGRVNALRKAAIPWSYLETNKLLTSQFPDQIKVPWGFVERPTTWK